MRNQRGYRRLALALGCAGAIASGGCGEEDVGGETDLTSEAGTNSEEPTGSNGGSKAAGGAPTSSPCGGCALLRVPHGNPDFPGAFQIFLADEPVDLSGTTITMRFWVESKFPGGSVMFFAFNPYVRQPPSLPIRSVEVASSSEPIELILDLSDLPDEAEGAPSGLGGMAGMEGMGGMGGAAGAASVPELPFDPKRVAGLALFVYGGTPEEGYNHGEVTVYLDEVRFSQGPLDDVTFDEGPSPVVAYRSLDGVSTELGWLE